VAAQRIVREIMSACLALEQPLTIAYLGRPEPTPSPRRASISAAHQRCRPAAGIDDVFRAVESGNAHYGVVPIENSTEGAIGRSLDLLLSSPLQICGEINLPIHHQLMGQDRALTSWRASTRTPSRWRNAMNG
jgi:chorismate mutase/prephenate dehydratase